MTYEHVWQDLERDPLARGMVRRRLRPSLPHDVFLQLEKPSGLRGLALGLEGPVGEAWRDIRDSRGVSVHVSAASPTQSHVTLQAKDTRFNEVFAALVEDLVSRLGDDVSTSSLDLLAGRLARWQVCLESSQDGLSEDRQAGLFAELAILVEVVATSVGPHLAVRSWRGPIPALQDFQLEGVALEVKSSRRPKPSTVIISSERQLDTTGCDRLFLLSVSVDARADGTGRTLPETVAQARQMVATAEGAHEELEDLLLSAGYAEVHAGRYRTRFTVRGIDCYLVGDGFPRITEADLPLGVGRVSYHLDLGVCEAWRTDLNALTEALSTEAKRLP